MRRDAVAALQAARAELQQQIETLTQQVAGLDTAIAVMAGRGGQLALPAPTPTPRAAKTGTKSGGRRLWSADEDALLRKLHGAGKKPALIAEQLRRPVPSIYSRIATLDLTAGTVPAKRNGAAPPPAQPLRQAAPPRKAEAAPPHARACADCGKHFRSSDDTQDYCGACR